MPPEVYERIAAAARTVGETVKELRADFQAAIDHYLADCAATGRTPLKAASGGKSLNQWAEEVLKKAAHIKGDPKCR